MSIEVEDDDPGFPEDNPEWTEADFTRARYGADIPAHILAAFPKTRLRGSQRAPTKVGVSLRLDRDVLEAFRAAGAGWQTRMNAALRKAAGLA